MTLALELVDELVLPESRLSPATSLRAALERRRSTRTFLAEPLTLDELSAILWCAFGVNRAGTPARTAPSAHDWREIDVYAVLAEATWRYDASAHKLELVAADDLRALTGVQDFVATAPLNLVYVADFGRMEGAREDERIFFAGADTGFIAQNVYLYCAAAGLATVVRGLVNRRLLAPALGLQPRHRITLAQTVGHSGEVGRSHAWMQ